MDIEMPRMNGIEAVAEVRSKYSQIKIIMITVFDDDENIFRAIQAGADCYLLKEVDAPSLHQAILDTVQNDAAMTSTVAMKAMKLLRNPSNFEKPTKEFYLTAREAEILEQTSKGINYNQIGENLIIPPKTVREHIENIYSKCRVHSKLKKEQKAVKNRIISIII
jgi:DNA-binding NarL/FixJ family response regulator